MAGIEEWLVGVVVDYAGYAVVALISTTLAGAVARFFYVPQIREMKGKIEALERADLPREGRARDLRSEQSYQNAEDKPGLVKENETVRAALERVRGLINPTDAQLSGALVQLLGTVDNFSDNGSISLNRENNERISVWPEEKDSSDNLRRGDRIKVVGRVKRLYRFGDDDMLQVDDARIEKPD